MSEKMTRREEAALRRHMNELAMHNTEMYALLLQLGAIEPEVIDSYGTMRFTVEATDRIGELLTPYRYDDADRDLASIVSLRGNARPEES